MSIKPVLLEADIELLEETAARREKAGTVIDLPQGKDKQPDLLYFSAIFVSSGENLNQLPSEINSSTSPVSTLATNKPWPSTLGPQPSLMPLCKKYRFWLSCDQ